MTDNIFGELHAKLNWRGQIESAKVKRCHIFSEDQPQCSDPGGYSLYSDDRDDRRIF